MIILANKLSKGICLITLITSCLCLLPIISMSQTVSIDDFEDGNITNELIGSWFSYDDRPNNGGNSVAQFEVEDGGYNSNHSGHLHYTLGDDFQYFFAGMATNTGELTPNGKTRLDLSNVTSLVLYIKGSGHQLDIVFQSALVTDNNNLVYKIKSTPTQWTQLTIDIPGDLECSFGSSCQEWDDVKQQITAIQFKASSRVNGEEGDVWVDDLFFTGSVEKSRPPACEPTVFGEFFTENFDAEPVGPYTFDQVKAAWNDPVFSNGVDKGRTKIVSSPSYGGNALEVKYPAGGYGSHESGAQWPLYFPDGCAYDSLYAEYKIYIPEGTDMAKGGKLPGFGGGANPTGGAPVDGTEGFSARLMWRKGSSGADANNIYVVNYMYHMDKPSVFGEDLWWSDPATDGVEESWTPDNKVYFETGKWHTVKNLVVINTPGKFDGKVIAWLDGVKVLENTSMRFRAEGVNSFKVDQFYFSTFYGGGSPDWAPQSDAYIYFDDFIISSEDPSPVVTNIDEEQVSSLEDKIVVKPSSIELSQTFESFILTGISGQVILRSDNVTGSIDLSHLPKGIYIAAVTGHQERIIKKIVVR